MADAPAPAAAPAAPAPTALEASFDARVAAAKGMSRPGGAPAAAPAKRAAVAKPAAAKAAPAQAAAENVDETPLEESPESEGLEAPPDSEEVDADDDGADDAAPGTDAERLAGAVKALETGDVEALAKALGADAKKLPLPTRKAFRAMARREAKLKAETAGFARAKQTAHAELSGESNRLANLQRGLAAKYAPADAAEKAWDAEDFTAVGKALEKQFKTDLATITQRLASGKSGKSADEKTLDQRKADLDRREAELQAKTKGEETAKTVAQRREVAVGKVGKALESHPYLVTQGADGKSALDPEALEEVFAAYEASWNGEKFTKTAKACADELQAKLESRARSRGLVKAPGASAAPGKTGKTVAKRAATGQRQPEPPRSGKTGSGALDLESTRDMRIANAKRMTEQQRRGLSG